MPHTESAHNALHTKYLLCTLPLALPQLPKFFSHNAIVGPYLPASPCWFFSSQDHLCLKLERFSTLCPIPSQLSSLPLLLHPQGCGPFLHGPFSLQSITDILSLSFYHLRDPFILSSLCLPASDLPILTFAISLLLYHVPLWRRFQSRLLRGGAC